MFNYTLITMATIITVGIMELIKLYLPEPTSARVKGLISLVLSTGFGVAGGFILQLDPTSICLNTAASVGLVQFSYDYLVKLLKKVIEKLQTKINVADAEYPLLVAQIQEELDKMFDEEECVCEKEEDKPTEEEKK